LFKFYQKNFLDNTAASPAPTTLEPIVPWSWIVASAPFATGMLYLFADRLLGSAGSGVAREQVGAGLGRRLGGALAHFCKHLITRFKQKFRPKFA